MTKRDVAEVFALLVPREVTMLCFYPAIFLGVF